MRYEKWVTVATVPESVRWHTWPDNPHYTRYNSVMVLYSEPYGGGTLPEFSCTVDHDGCIFSRCERKEMD